MFQAAASEYKRQKKTSPEAVQGDAKSYNTPKSGAAEQIRSAEWRQTKCKKMQRGQRSADTISELRKLAKKKNVQRENTTVWLVGVVDVDVLQELGAKGRVGPFGAGQDLQHVSVVWAQENHRVVLVRPCRRVHRDLGQLEPGRSEVC